MKLIIIYLSYKDHMNHDEFRLDETIIKKQC